MSLLRQSAYWVMCVCVISGLTGVSVYGQPEGEIQEPENLVFMKKLEKLVSDQPERIRREADELWKQQQVAKENLDENKKKLAQSPFLSQKGLRPLNVVIAQRKSHHSIQALKKQLVELSKELPQLQKTLGESEFFVSAYEGTVLILHEAFDGKPLKIGNFKLDQMSQQILVAVRDGRAELEAEYQLQKNYVQSQSRFESLKGESGERYQGTVQFDPQVEVTEIPAWGKGQKVTKKVRTQRDTDRPGVLTGRTLAEQLALLKQRDAELSALLKVDSVVPFYAEQHLLTQHLQRAKKGTPLHGLLSSAQQRVKHQLDAIQNMRVQYRIEQRDVQDYIRMLIINQNRANPCSIVQGVQLEAAERLAEELAAAFVSQGRGP